MKKKINRFEYFYYHLVFDGGKFSLPFSLVLSRISEPKTAGEKTRRCEECENLSEIM
jgi:hypothetical protein